MSYQIELRHLNYFLAVAEDLHFRKAAERLYISQPGLSRQIQQMEDHLGVTLFDRHNRKVELTKSGEYLQKEITEILKRLEATLDHSRLLGQGLAGDLKLGYVGSAMQNIIPNMLLKFREENPNVVFSLKEMDNQKQVDELLSHNLDLGFVRLERVPRGLGIKPILEETFSLVLPKDHPIHVNNFESLLQFKNESFILFDPAYSATYYEKVMQIFDDCKFTPIVTHNTIHAGSIYKLVENNFGISIVPKSLETFTNERIKFIELQNISQRTTMSIVWNNENRNPILDRFLNSISNDFTAL
ncbi:DNA-binding transcriptional LysR family regulator [Flavobacteriaceae bacterium MAR_2010_72]|nr:DNA-binding transcriptional LysR family regulator [Flavobacteriaceae bacterium MAR_2010_72]TVZ57969.1 DNA-binding transcriptional LysR family regulator [Flavobacteriaceae bacterium MAR_2010_105]